MSEPPGLKEAPVAIPLCLKDENGDKLEDFLLHLELSMP